MFIKKLKKHLSIIFVIVITTNTIHSRTQNNLIKLSINEEQDKKHLHKEKDLMLAFFDIVHESIENNEKLKKKMEEITGTSIKSIKDTDIKDVMKFIDGDNKSKLKSLTIHVSKVLNQSKTLTSLRTVLVKIAQEIHRDTEMKTAINKFLQDVQKKADTYKKLIKAEKSYSMEHQEQKEIINAKNVNTALSIIAKIFNKHMISNHNLDKYDLL